VGQNLVGPNLRTAPFDQLISSQTGYKSPVHVGTSYLFAVLNVELISLHIDAKSHAFGLRLTLFDPISRYHAIETEYHAFFKILQIEEKVLINLN